MTYELVMNSLTIENCSLVKDKGMDAASNGLDPGGGGGGVKFGVSNIKMLSLEGNNIAYEGREYIS